MKVCGPKLALCGIVISVWGIIQLVLMGFFYYIKAVALIEDLPMPEEASYKNAAQFYSAIDKGFDLNAYNCWIAACLYLFTLAFSGYQFYVNSRSSVM